MSKDTIATIVFAGYASLMAFRDVATGEYLDKEITDKPNHYLWITFTICAVILVLSMGHVLLSKQSGIVKKLRKPGAMLRVILLGLFCGGIYLGIIYLLSRLGAGLGGLLDYGFGPFAIAIVGSLMFKEKLTADFFAAFLVCLLGLLVLLVGREFLNLQLLGIALLVPMASALSDGYVKWLLDEKNAGLTSSEVLAVRFLPAVVMLYALAATNSGSLVPQMEKPYTTVVIGALGGWVPLMLLCTGLGIAAMKKLAMWEITIPAFTFLATLPVRPGNLGFRPLLGAALVLSGVVISEKKGLSRLRRKEKEAKGEKGRGKEKSLTRGA